MFTGEMLWSENFGLEKTLKLFIKIAVSWFLFLIIATVSEMPAEVSLIKQINCDVGKLLHEPVVSVIAIKVQYEQI